MSKLESELQNHKPSPAATSYSPRPTKMTSHTLKGYTSRFKNHLHQQMKHPLAQKIASLETFIDKNATAETLDEVAKALEIAARRTQYNVFGK